MTKVIEIVVIGGTGSGKSHVLELIDKALRDGYGPHVQVVSRDLSLERGLGSPGAEPSADTIFNLKEQGVASGGGKSSGSLKVEVDTSAIDSALEKIEALGKDYWRSQIASGSIEELQGFTTGYTVDPLESAIESTTQIMRDEYAQLVDLSKPNGGEVGESSVFARMAQHLDKLLALQLKRLSEPTVVQHSQVGDVPFTELTSGRRK